MTLVLMSAILAFTLFASPPTLAQIIRSAPAGTQGADPESLESQSVQDHVITVSRSGEAYAKPDLGILVMSIQSSSPIADEAVAQNGQKAMAVESALTGLGFTSGGYQITSVTFGQAAGGPRFPGQSEITAYNATQYVYVLFEAVDLNDVARLTQKSAAIIEALRKAGAVPANAGPQMGPVFPGAPGALIIYTVKDPAQYEHQAMQVAIGRARDAAQDIAVGVKVQITGLRNVQSTFLRGNVMPRTGQSPLTGLKYRWYSTKSDELEIIANATVQYDFK
jgi:uncharacterized protein YggE